MASEVEFMDRKGSCQEGSLVASGPLASKLRAEGRPEHGGIMTCVVIDPGSSQWLPVNAVSPNRFLQLLDFPRGPSLLQRASPLREVQLHSSVFSALVQTQSATSCSQSILI